MNKIAITLGSSACGLAICFAFIWASQTLGISAKFPSPGGEDDFALRAQWFLFGVCPAFLLLGALIGYFNFRSVRALVVVWCGALTGSVIVFATTRLLQYKIDVLLEDRAANHAVLAFDIAWVGLSALCAMVMQKWRRIRAAT